MANNANVFQNKYREADLMTLFQGETNYKGRLGLHIKDFHSYGTKNSVR